MLVPILQGRMSLPEIPKVGPSRLILKWKHCINLTPPFKSLTFPVQLFDPSFDSYFCLVLLKPQKREAASDKDQLKNLSSDIKFEIHLKHGKASTWAAAFLIFLLKKCFWKAKTRFNKSNESEEWFRWNDYYFSKSQLGELVSSFRRSL